VFSNIAYSAVDSQNLQKERDHTWKFLVYFSIVSGFLMCSRIILLYLVNPSTKPESPLSICTEGVEPICAPQTCATTGVFHLQWTFRMLKPGYILPGVGIHFMTMFVAPMLLGLKFASVVLFWTGPGLATMFPGTKTGEWAAIWCFFSIGEALVTVLAQYAALRLAARKVEEKEKVVEVVETKNADLVRKKNK
jgi:hypothetical protein